MHINVTIDRGNTATKILIWEGRKAIWRHTFPEFSRDDAEKIQSRYGQQCHVILCSVAGDDETFMSMLRDVFGETNVEILSSKTPLPIVIDYDTPETLGMDRVAAAAGAWTLHRGSNLLVVDIGTAVTYDVVRADGHYMGGNIAPGIGMRLKALQHFTAKLPLVDSRGETGFPGTSTETAIRSGCVMGVVGEIKYYLSQLPADTRVVITGGWGTDLARLLDSSIRPTVKPCLVSIGLNSILSYNETK